MLINVALNFTPLLAMGGVVSAQAGWSDKGALEFNPNNNKLIQGIISLVEVGTAIIYVV